jgi:hypothetical protein
MNGIYELESWKDYSKKIPLVAVVGLVNEWMTIYACLQQAVKVFDHVLVIGDGVDKKTLSYFNKFKSDFELIGNSKIEFIELGNFNPWPWLSLYDFSCEKYKNLNNLPIKSASKADYKRLSLAKSMHGNSILCSLHSDIILFDDSRNRIIDRMSNIENPLFDSEWYSLITLYDRKTAKTFYSKDSKPGNLIKDPNLNQRKIYDYPGDWGLMSFYGSSLILPGPDPKYPFATCMWPWSSKTQLEKKGHDNSLPHAIHLEYIRDRDNLKDFKNESWSFWETKKFENEDLELHEKLKVLDDLYFPVNFNLNNDNLLIIESKEE